MAFSGVLGALFHCTVLVAIIQGESTVLTTFDFTTYPSLQSLLATEPAQPKQTGGSSSIRFSILYPELICQLAKGRIVRVKAIIPKGSVGSDFQIQIWRQNPNETFTLIDKIVKTFSTEGVKVLDDGIDFSDKVMQYNDIIGIWVPWTYPVAALTSTVKNVYYILKQSPTGIDQNPPAVRNTESVSAVGPSLFRLAFSVELESVVEELHDLGFSQLNKAEKEFRIKRESGEQVTVIYATGMKGEPGDLGSVGDVGLHGQPGATGMTGVKGETGLKGSKGTAGDPGDNGIYTSGLTGEQGAQGLPGPTGNPGATGLSGALGSTGLPGAKGVPGLQGIVGREGQKGQRGIPGDPGTAGPQGTPGDSGDGGDKGDSGDQGAPGPQGQRGPAGGSLSEVLDSLSPCSNFRCINSECKSTLLGPKCICNNGFEPTTNETICKDMDECKLLPCSQSCKNTIGSFECSCFPGFKVSSMSKSMCIQDTTNKCGSCESNQICKELGGSFQCIPSSLNIHGTGQAKAAGLVGQSYEDVMLPNDRLMSDEWVIVFIVWGIVLTILALVIGVWYAYERKLLTYDKSEFDRQVNMTGTFGPNVIYLDPCPPTLSHPTTSLSNRYNTALRTPYQHAREQIYS